MAVLVLTCPHCNREAAMSVFGVRMVVKNTEDTGSWRKVVIGAACPSCTLPISALAKFDTTAMKTDPPSLAIRIGQMQQSPEQIQTNGYELIDSWPKPLEVNLPEHLPRDAASAFREAERNFLQNQFIGAGMLYRRSLERALKAKYPGRKKDSLATIIEGLVEDHTLTASIGEWAHSIRLIGNDAAHDDDINEEDAKALRGFTDAVLRYVWTLPGDVEMRRMLQ